MLPPMIIMFMIFYFILIRPQQKKQQEQRKMLDDLKEGENVVTLSGIHGTIHKLRDDIVTLQIADNVRIKINRGSIGTSKTQSEGAASEKETAAETGDSQKGDNDGKSKKDKKSPKKKKGA